MHRMNHKNLKRIMALVYAALILRICVLPVNAAKAYGTSLPFYGIAYAEEVSAELAGEEASAGKQQAEANHPAGQGNAAGEVSVAEIVTETAKETPATEATGGVSAEDEAAKTTDEVTEVSNAADAAGGVPVEDETTKTTEASVEDETTKNTEETSAEDETTKTTEEASAEGETTKTTEETSAEDETTKTTEASAEGETTKTTEETSVEGETTETTDEEPVADGKDTGVDGEEADLEALAAEAPMMLTSAAPNGGTDNVVPDYASAEEIAKNGVQTAIDEALKKAGTDERITVTMKAGAYEGDITIKLESRPATNFVLELVAEDAGKDYLSSTGLVTLAGNINIENVDVLLAGIYLALDKKVSITDSNTEIYGTAQDDTINVDLRSEGSVDIATGSGDDDVTVNVMTDAEDLSVSTGAGDDTVTIAKFGDTGTGDYRGNNTATVDTGAGADKVQIDVGVADTYQEVTVHNESGAAGINAVNFTGLLDDASKSKGDAIKGKDGELTFRNAKGNTLIVKNSGEKVAKYTDTLVNKPTIILDNENLQLVDGVYKYNGSAAEFTDYVLNLDPAEVTSIAINGGGLLSRFVIDAGRISGFGSDKTMTVHNVTAKDMNVGIYGNEIEIDGKIIGNNVNIEATDGSQKSQTTAEGSIGNIIADFSASLLNVEHTAKVTVKDTAEIIAKGNIEVSAKVEQTRGLTTILALSNNIGVVDVKIGNATVDVAGTLKAGYDADKGVFIENGGDARITAEVKTEAKGEGFYAPLAVVVAVENTGIKIHDGAVITAGGSVKIRARGSIVAENNANTQSYLPLVLDTSILVNNVHVQIDDAAITALAGNVNVTSRGYLRSRAMAMKGEEDLALSGGFFGVSVAVQDVTAEATNGSSITAKGNVKIASRGDADARTVAIATVGTAKASALNQTTTTSQMTKLLLQIWNSVDTKLNLTGKISEKAISLITGLLLPDSKNVAVSESSSVPEYGTASVKKAKVGVGRTVTVNVQPKNGRDVETIRYRYLEPGAAEYKFKDVELSKAKKNDTTYEFDMPDSDIVVYVTYKSAPGKTYSATGNDPFDAGSGAMIEMQDLSGIVDQATADTAEHTEDTSSTMATENSLAADAMTLSFGPFTEENKGAVLTAYDDGTGKPLSKLDAGSSTELVVNPASGYGLKKNSLTLTYTREGGTTVRTILSPDSNGKYILTMPSDAKQGTEVTVNAEFEPTSGDRKEDKNAASSQAVGALATGVLENSNETIIDLAGGAITAGGKTEFLSDGSTSNDVYADATRVTKSAVEAAKMAEAAAEKSRTVTQYAQGGAYSVKVNKVTGGTVTYTTTDGQVIFTPTCTDTDAAVSCVCHYTDELGAEHYDKLERGADGNFVLDLKQMKGKGGTEAQVDFVFNDSEDTASTEAFYVENFANPVQLTAKGRGKIEQSAYKYDGNYLLKFTPEPGYKISTLLIVYKDPDGKNETITQIYPTAEGEYSLDVSALPKRADGKPITVTAQFEAYNRPVNVIIQREEAETKDHGTLAADQTVAKETDVVTGTVTPEDGYKASEVAYVYTDASGTQQVGFADLKDGKFSFVMPKMRDGIEYNLDIKTTFVKKDVAIVAEGEAGTFAIAQSRADRKESTAITPVVTEDGTQKPDVNKKLTNVVIKAYDKNNQELTNVEIEFKDGQFTIPEDSDHKIATVKVSADTVDKALAITAQEPAAEQGKVKVSAERTEPGETVSVNFDLNDGFIVKDGTAKAVIKGTVETVVNGEQKEDGSYTFAIPKDCVDGDVEIKYEIVEGTPAKKTADLYVGTGIGVAVTGGENAVRIKSGTITAQDGFAAQAITGTSASNAVARSGYSEAKVAIGGAIAVNIGTLSTNALVYQPAAVTANGGTVKLKASVRAGFITTGDSSEKTDKSNTGVGAGIAVAVNSSDAYAAIQDGTAFTFGKNVTQIELYANQILTDAVTAKAGSAGNTAVTPCAAIDIFASDTVATLGKILGDIDIQKATGSELALAAVRALNKATHTLTADAAAAGKGVGLGGAFGIAVISDVADAALEKAMKANGIYVGADSQSTMKMTVKAGANGGAEGNKGKDGSSGSADKKADALAKSAASLSNGKNKNSGAQKVSEKLNGRQQAQTGEGSVAGAAALALNILDNTAKAELSGGNFEAAGLADAVEPTFPLMPWLPLTVNDHLKDMNGTIRVKSINRTEAQLSANASATKSTYGVGVAVGINIIDLTNTAKIVDSKIIADKLDVEAVLPDSTLIKTDIVSTSKTSEVVSKVEEIAHAIVKKYFEALKIDSWLGADEIELIISEVAGEFANNFLAASGVDKIFEVDSIEDQAKENLAEVKKNIPDELLSVLRLVLIDQLGEEKGGKAYTAISGDVKKQLTGVADGFSLNIDKDELIALRNDLITALVTNLAAGAVNGNLDENALADTLAKTVYKVLSQAYTKLETLEKLKDALKNYDPSLSGIAGSVVKAFEERLPETVTDIVITMLKPVDLPKLLKYLNSGVKDTLENNIRTALAKASVKVTEAEIKRLDEKYDLVLTQEDETNKHVFRTESVSGAGAAKVGVAGSVALLVLNEETKALITGGGTQDVTVNGEMILTAADTRRITTAASASANESGEANTNDGAGSESNDAGSGKADEQTLEGEYSYITVLSGPGYTFEADIANKKGRIIPEEGYEFTDLQHVSYIYTDKNGKEKTGTILIGENGTFTLPQKKDDMPEDGQITIKPVMQEVLKGLPMASVLADVKVKLPDRDGDDVSKARPGETVQIIAPVVSGKHVDKVTYTYNFTNENGETESKTVTVNAVAYTNAEEAAYSFRMPDGDITAINVTYADGSDDKGTTNSKGESVGVGASFAMVYGDSKTEAEISIEQGLTVSGDLKITAAVDDVAKTIAVAGTDPMALKKQENVTDISVDAAVSLNLLDSAAKAKYNVAGSSTVSGSVTVDAKEKNITASQASGFAVGKATAVGAAVALNIGENSASATVAGSTLSAGGELTVRSAEYSEDTVRAIATALGADVQRVLNKYSDKLTATTANVNKLLNGSLFKETKAKQSNDNNSTATKITDKLNKGATGEDKASNNHSISTNVLRTQNVKTEGNTQANSTVSDASTETNSALNGSASVTPGQNEVNESKFQVAAATAVNVATHNAQTSTAIDLIHLDKAQITSEAVTNTRTLGTAAAISKEVGANSISAGVAVSVNNSAATTNVTGSVTGEKGNVSITSSISQNLSGSYAGRLAAQSLAGAVSGKDSSASIAGAISVLVSNAAAKTNIVNDISGEVVTVIAEDKSRLTARAGGVSISKGSSVGVGAAFSSVFTNDKVKANVAEGVTITADSFEFAARKKEVTYDDYQRGLDLTTIMTDSSKLTPEQRTSTGREIGIIDVHKGKDAKGKAEKNYSVSVNLSTDKLLSIMDLMNFLSGVNYYTEAVAGSIVTGTSGSKATVAGSFAVTHSDNEVTALIGNSVKINAIGKTAIEAIDENTYRTIAGAVSAGTSKAGVGLTLGYLQNDDTVKAELGEGAAVITQGAYSQQVSRKADAQVYTAAAAIGVGKDNVADVGGAVNVILLAGKAENLIGANSHITAGAAIDVATKNKLDLMLISADAQVTAGKVAAGGTVAVIVNQSIGKTSIANNAALTAVGDASITADEKAQLISAIASISAAKGTAGVAGALSVLISRSNTEVDLGDNVTVDAQGSNKISATADSWLLNAGLAAAGADTAAVGAAVSAEVLKRNALVNIGSGAKLHSGNAAGALEVTTGMKDVNFTVQLSGSVAPGTAGISGTIPVIVSENKGQVKIGENADIQAAGAVGIDSHYSARLYGISGALAYGGTAGVGATIQTVVLNNTIETILAKNAAIKAGSGSWQDKKGVYVGADADETLLLVAIGGAAAGTAAVSGAVNTLVVTNKVKADVETANVTVTGGDYITEAIDNTHIADVAGGLGVAGTAAVGAAVVTQVIDKTVDAAVSNSTVEASGAFAVHSQADDEIDLIAVSAGVAGTAAVEVGSVVNVYENDVKSSVSGTAVSSGSMAVTADKAIRTENTAVAVAASGTAAVTPVASVTVLGGESSARVDLDNKQINVTGEMDITAETSITADPTVAGVAASGAAAVSGAVAVLVSNAQTIADLRTAGSGAVQAGAVGIHADDSYRSNGMSGTLAASGTAGVAVNALVSVIKNTVSAAAHHDGTANGNQLTATNGGIDVEAISGRDVVNMGSSLGVAGTAGVSVAVMVLAAGDQMTQDASDALAHGSKGSKATTFDSTAFLGNAFDRSNSGYTAKYKQHVIEDTSAALCGDGTYDSETKVGNNGFDAATGYRQTEDAYQTDNAIDAEFNSQSADITNAKQLEVRTNIVRNDAVRAYLDEHASAAGDITVKADSKTQLDAMTASLGGGTAGVGFGVNVAVLRSNVIAETGANSDLKAGGGIRILANSGSEKITGEDNTGDLNTLLGNSELAADGRSVRVISAAAGAGGVGVAIPVAVLRMDNYTLAHSGGKISGAKALSVESSTRYPVAMAATVGLSAGLTGFSGSVAVASAGGKSEALIDQQNNNVWAGNAEMNVSVKNSDTTDATAVAVAAGVGATAVNAAVAVAANRTDGKAHIDGAKMGSVGLVTVSGNSTTRARAYTLGISAGGTSASIGAAVTIVSPTNESYIAGSTSGGRETAFNSGSSIAEIKANTESEAISKSLAAAAGITAIAGNALLAFNDSVTSAFIKDADVKAEKLNIYSNLKATALTDSATATAGISSFGVNVGFVELKAANKAFADLMNLMLDVKKLDVKANADSQAEAKTSVAGFSAINVGFNATIADNHMTNRASVRSEEGMKQLIGTAVRKIGEMNVTAEGTAKTYAYQEGRTYNGINAGASFVLALQRVEQTAERTENVTAGISNLGGLNITSKLNEGLNDQVLASVKTAGYAIMKANASVVAAYGRSKNTARLTGKQLTLIGNGNVNVTASGNSGAKATVANGSDSILTATLFLTSAYARDGITAEVFGFDELKAASLNVKTDYAFSSYSSVQPAVYGKVDLGLAKIQANYASAKTISTAVASLKNNKRVTLTGALQAASEGSVTAYAETVTPKVTVSASLVNVAVNKASANVAADPKTNYNSGVYVTNNELVTVNGSVGLTSKINKLSAEANAEGFNGEVKLSFANGDTHTAESVMAGKNNIMLTDTTLKAADVTILADSGRAESTAKTMNKGTNASLATVGNLKANADGISKIYIGVKNSKIDAAGNIAVDAKADVAASALGVSPRKISGVTYSKSYMTAGVGKAITDGWQSVNVEFLGDAIHAKKDFNVSASNTGSAISDLQNKKISGISLAQLTGGDLSASGYYATNIRFDAASVPTAVTAENINISLYDNEKSTSVADSGKSISGIDLSSIYGNNKVEANDKITIGSGTEFNANRSISVTNDNAAEVNTATKSSSFSLLANGSTVKANTSFKRSVILDIGENAKISANYGDMSFILSSGVNDVVQTSTYASGDSIFDSFDTAQSNVDTTADVQINIAKGAQVRNPFGYITMHTVTGMESSASASAHGGGFVAKPKAKTTLNVKQAGNISVVGAKIEAKYLDLTSMQQSANYYATTSAKGSGVGSKPESYATINLKQFEAQITNTDAKLIGHDALMILTDTDAAGAKIKSFSDGRTAGLYASGTSEANVNGTVRTKINASGSEYYSGAISLLQNQLDSTKVQKIVREAKMTKKGLFGSPSRKTTGTVTYDYTQAPAKANKYYLGMGVAGIAVDVYEENGGALMTRAYGLGGRMGGRLLPDGNVLITDLASFGAGSLIAGNGTGKAVNLYGAEVIHLNAVPEFTVTNSSNHDIILGKILESSGYKAAHMNVAGADNYNRKDASVTGGSTINVLTSSGKDVYLSDIIDAPGAVATFNWKGAKGSLYNLGETAREKLLNFMEYICETKKVWILETIVAKAVGDGSAPKLFVKKLVSENGADLGTSADRLEALLFGGEEAALSLKADNIYLTITPAKEKVITDQEELTTSNITAAYKSSVDFKMGEIKAAGLADIKTNDGVIYLHTEDPVQVYDVADSLRYMETTKTLAELYNIFGKDADGKPKPGFFAETYTQTHGSIDGTVVYQMHRTQDGIYANVESKSNTLDGITIADFAPYYQGNDENGLEMYSLPDGTILWVEPEEGATKTTLGKVVKMQLMMTMQDGSRQAVLYDTGDAYWKNKGTYGGYTYYTGHLDGVGELELDTETSMLWSPLDEMQYYVTLENDTCYQTDLANVNSRFIQDMIGQGAQIAYRDDDGNLITSTTVDISEHDDIRRDYTYTDELGQHTVRKTYLGITEEEAVRRLSEDDWKPVYIWYEQVVQNDDIGSDHHLNHAVTESSTLVRVDRDVVVASEDATEKEMTFELDEENALIFEKSGDGYIVRYNREKVGEYDPSEAVHYISLPGSDHGDRTPVVLKQTKDANDKDIFMLYMMDQKSEDQVPASVKIVKDADENSNYTIYLMDPGSDIEAAAEQGKLTVYTDDGTKPVTLTLNNVFKKIDGEIDYTAAEVVLGNGYAAQIGIDGDKGVREITNAQYDPKYPLYVLQDVYGASSGNFTTDTMRMGSNIRWENTWTPLNDNSFKAPNWNDIIAKEVTGENYGVAPYYWIDGDTPVHDLLIADIYANSIKGFSLQGNILGGYSYVQNGKESVLTVSKDASGKQTFILKNEDGTTTTVAEREIAADGTVYVTANGVKIGSDHSYEVIDAKQQNLITRAIVNSKTTTVLTDTADIEADTLIMMTQGTVAGSQSVSVGAPNIRTNNLVLNASAGVGSADSRLNVGSLDDGTLTETITSSGNVYVKSAADNTLVNSISGDNVDLEFAGELRGNKGSVISANNLQIRADGKIGANGDPLKIRVSGNVSVNYGESGDGHNNVWYVNLYNNDPSHGGSKSEQRRDRLERGLIPVYELNELENAYITCVNVLLRSVDFRRVRDNRLNYVSDMLTAPVLVAMMDLATGRYTQNRSLTFIRISDLAAGAGRFSGVIALADAIHEKAADFEGKEIWYLYARDGEICLGSTSVSNGECEIVFEGETIDYLSNNGFVPFVMLSESNLERASEKLELYMARLS